MKFNFISKLVFREIKNTPKFVVLFCLNLTLGLLGPTLVETFKDSFQTLTDSQSKRILGADLSIGGRFPIKDEAFNKITAELPKHDIAESKSMFSMISHGKRTRLCSLRSFDKNFPFYGAIKTKGEKTYSQLSDDEVLVYPEILSQLDVKVGESLEIGVKKFKIVGVIQDDAGQSFRMNAMAPRIYLTLAALDQTELIQKGSTAWNTTYFKIDTEEENLKKIKDDVTRILADISYNVNIPKTASTQVGRMIRYLNDYLGLTSLVALFLAMIGLFYLYRSYLNERKKDVGILICLGLRRKQIFQIYMFHLCVLAFISTIACLIISVGLFPAIEWLFVKQLNMNINVSFDFSQFIKLALLALTSTILFGAPLVYPLTKIRQDQLFHYDLSISRSTQVRSTLFFVPAFLFIYALAFYLSKSWLVSTIFISTLVFFFLFTIPIVNYLMKFIEKISSDMALAYRLGIRYLTRHKRSTFSLFFAMAFCSLLFNTLIGIYGALNNELKTPLEKGGPTYFLFDIQDEQKNELIKVSEQEGVELDNISPMIRARLLSVNGQTLDVEVDESATREQEQSIRMRNRGINLSYRSKLDESERIIEGEYFTKEYKEDDPYVELSLEKRYAGRIGAKLGDMINFDIFGLEYKGKVTSLRKVRWSSFRPNFFILVQPGLLELAPKTYLAITPDLNYLKVDKEDYQTNVVREFPNVSLVDVGRLIRKIIDVMGSLYVALTSMAVMTLIVVFLVLFAIIRHQITQRSNQLALLKFIGMKNSVIMKMVNFEFILITLLATTFGAIVGGGLGQILSYTLFETLVPNSVIDHLISTVGLTVLMVGLIYLTTRKRLLIRPTDLLHDA